MDMESSLGEVIMTSDDLSEKILNIAHDIVSFFSPDELKESALIGIQSGGVPLAHRISRIIQNETSFAVEVGSLDITFYRDDFGSRIPLPTIRETLIPFDINNRIIILVDDVLQSGRSVRAALDALIDYGRPAQIRLVSLIDRGMREYPINANFVGCTIKCDADWHVSVDWGEFGGSDCAYKIKAK